MSTDVLVHYYEMASLGRSSTVMYSDDGLRGPKSRPSARASSSIYMSSARIMDYSLLYAGHELTWALQRATAG